MSKKLSILMLLMTLFVPWAANAQQTVTIGSGTSGKPTHPVHMVYAYSLTQQIYTADEIGMAGTITSIAFDYTTNNGSFTMDGFQVYMMQVDKSVFASTTDIVALTDATLVYDGTFSANGAGWVTLQLSTPFPYDGESNLLVCCFDPDSGKPGSSHKFNTTTTTGYTAIVYFDNTRVPDLTDVSTFAGSKSYYKYHNNIQLVIAPTECQKPSTLEADGYTLTWTGGSGSYNVEYKKASDNNWTRAFTNLSATTCTLTLDPITQYDARVQSVCSGNETSGWRTVSFTTPCSGITLFPWTENFEHYDANVVPECWDNSASTSPTASGSNSHYVWGVYSYSNNKMLRLLNSSSVQSGTALINSPEFVLPSSGSYELTFNYSHRANCGDFIVKISEDGGTTFTDLESYTTTNSTTSPSNPGTFTGDTISLTAYAGKSVIFQFFANANSGSGAIFIDNVKVKETINVTATHIVNNVTNPNTQMTWAQFAEYVSEGVSFEGVTLTLDENITVTDVVGSENEPFCGIFDGNNNTINANITSDGKAAAPFRYISGATIRDLTVTGSITCADYHAGGLVGYAFSGTNTIENCLVSTTLHIKTYGGGIVGHGKNSTLHMTGCVFNGNIDNTDAGAATDNNRGVGGLVGWCDASAKLYITDCLYDGTYGGNGASVFFHPVACKTGGATVTSSINNCYYTCDQEQADSDGNSNVVTTAGRKAYSVTAISPVTMTNNAASTVYDVSGITGYGTNWGGILYNNVLYGGQGKNLSLNLQGSPTDLYQTNYGTLSGTTNPYTLNMAANNTEISALTCVAPTGLTVSNVGAHRAVVTWDRVATQETGPVTFEYVCVEHGATPDWTNATSVIDDVDNPNLPTAQPSGLTTETQYDIYVRRNCGNGDYSLAVMATFTTTIACPAPTNLDVNNITGHTATATWTGSSDGYNVFLGSLGPNGNVLNVNFANGIPSNWNNSSSYPWTVTADGHIQSGNAGVASSTSSISVTATFPASGTVEFDALCMGEGTSTIWDKCIFSIDNVAQFTHGADVSGWNHYTFNVASGTHTFTWSYTKDGSVNPTGDYFAIDDVVMIASSIIWGDPVYVENTEYTFTGLTGESRYFVKVQSNCGNEGVSAVVGPIAFDTDVSCMPPTNLTATNVNGNSALLTWQGYGESYNVGYISTVFFEGFEDYSSQEVPTGWTVYKNGTTNSVAWSVYNPSQYLSGVSAHSGNNVAIAFSRPNNQGDNWLITPQLDLQGTLKFWVKRGTGDSRQDRYEVRLSTTGIDTVDFNVTLKPREVASDEWEEVVINLGDYEGQQGYIAIHHYHFGGYYLMVDDFSISGWVTASADTTSFVYEGLMPETEYQWKVQAQCGEDGESVWVSSSFTTLESCPTPIDVTATYPTAYGATLNWTGYSDSYTVKVGATTNYGFENNVISEDFTNSTTYPWTITTADKHSGTRCVKSASGFASANSDLKLTVTLEQAGTISFWEKVSSEASIDQGSFLIDNRTQYTTSGSTDWTFHSFELTSGAHTLTWRYYKNGSGDEGNDCFYVDDIAFTPWSLYTVTELPFILDDATHILPITTYTVIVQGNCGDEVSLGSAPISFTTACVPIANLPMSEDFNDYSTGIASATTAPSGYPNSHQLPHCWQFLNLSASTSTYPQAFLSSSSTYAVYDKCLLLKSSSQTPLYAILPEFEIATSTLQLTFTYRNEGVANTDGTLHVGYMTDPTVDSTFVSLYTCAKTTTKTTETVYFMNAPDDSYMVFKYQGGTSNGKILSIDDVAVEQIPSCFPVGILSYDSLTSNTVNLSWPLVDTTQTAWQISVMTGDQEQFVNANSNENFLLDLSPATEYTLKVRAFCGGNDYGEWSNEITFTTLESCPTPTNVTYSNITAVSADISWIGREDVESYRVRYRPAEGIVARYMEDFNYDLDNWTMVDCESRTGILNGVFAFYRVTDVNNPNPHQYLISPELTSFITSNSVLEFKYRAANQNYAETFMVGFSSTNNEVESFSWGDSITVATTVYQTYHADLPAGTKYIAIQCISHRKYYLYIDDIIIGNEASVGQWMTKNTTETEAQLINLNGGTTYEVQVRSNCDLDSWSEMITFNTELDGTMVLVSEGDWNTASNWLPQGTPALNSKVILRADATIPSGCVAEANRILFEGTTLTINDGGQLKTNFDVNATMKKNITGYGESNGNYYLMAVPINVTNSAPSNYITITAESNFDLYGWNRTATCEEWQNFKQNSFALSNGEGYLFADSTDVELSFTGTIKANNVNVTKNPDYDAASGGWNLYGNPFACDIYLTTEAEGMAFYRLIDTIFVAATGPIAPMEGFFAQATATGQTFTITREAPAKCGQLNMSLNHNGSSIDNALIIFGEGQNLGKMSFRENSSKVYMPVNGKDCAAVFTGNVGEMPVNFVAKENGSFTLSFSNENVTFSYLHLIDTITGADVNLLQTPSYSFEASTTDNANRFKVVYTTIKH
ncbi:MAG: choice-of-anchor J domain-containing protein [Bacteroidales bacterium]|nr:choice-of-anchor J domain-containing protein [Bacteroidales bacterium]